jgi:hypothetical protein
VLASHVHAANVLRKFTHSAFYSRLLSLRAVVAAAAAFHFFPVFIASEHPEQTFMFMNITHIYVCAREARAAQAMAAGREREIKSSYTYFA